MTRRHTSLGVLMTLVACVLVLWLLGRDDPGPSDAGQSGGTQDQETPASPLLHGSGKEPVGEPAESAAPRPQRSSHAKARASGAREAPRVTGTVRYVDGTAPVAFVFTLFRPTGPGTGGGWQIKGNEGSFEGPAVMPGRYEIRKVRADGGEPAVVNPSVTYVRGEPLLIVLRHGQQARLLVVDAETGAVLPDARAHRSRDALRITPTSESGEAYVPGTGTLKAPPEAADRAGIIVLPPMSEATKWFIGAPDHAWKRLSVVASAEGVITVRLAAGGTAVVNVPNLDQATNPVLIADRREVLPKRLSIYGGQPPMDDAGTFRIEGLPEGFLTIAVGRSDGIFGVAQVYAFGRVEIRRGTEAHLTLLLDLGPPLKKVALRGTLDIPKAWKRSPQPWQLFFRGAAGDERTKGYRAEARLAPGGAGRPTSFEADAVPEGEYELLLKPLYWLHRVTVREDMAPLEIVVPPPVQVRVRVTDAATGTDIPGAQLQYAPTISRPTSWRWHDSKVDRETREHIFRCPASMVRLSVTASGYQARVEDVEPKEVAVAPFVVELSEAGALRLQLRHRGRPVSAKGVSIWVSSPACGRSASGRGEVLEVDGLAPGEWTVKVKKIAGYRLPPLQTVVVEAGKSATLTIDLEADGG